ncbi:hypothetical protein BHE74_00032300 [Ensete ventricosum]|nr:hypothetical protein BHE74_00032300 [Ensete ventricosum]
MKPAIQDFCISPQSAVPHSKSRSYVVATVPSFSTIASCRSNCSLCPRGRSSKKSAEHFIIQAAGREPRWKTTCSTITSVISIRFHRSDWTSCPNPERQEQICRRKQRGVVRGEGPAAVWYVKKAQRRGQRCNATLPSIAEMHAAPCHRFTVADADGLHFCCGFTFFNFYHRAWADDSAFSPPFVRRKPRHILHVYVHVHDLRLLDMRRGVNTVC